MRWGEEIKIGAAREFGARHHGLILGMAAARRVFPWLLTLAALAFCAWWIWTVALHWLILSGVIAALSVGIWRAWRWWYPSASMSRVPAFPIMVIAALSVGGTALAMWVM